jgi:hypothetical protein
MSTELTPFENRYLQVMQDLATLTRKEKALAESNKQLKAQLEVAMDANDIKSIDNEYLKITRVAASSTTSIDLKKLEKQEPNLHKELLDDYPKVNNRKSHVKFTVK